ncbi:hypothetical protein A3Q32_12380 [Alcanivorax sp. KX64203]|nr:hypothetical protein A3Q32_12380 [Alcanivorax sp. KX64203]
MKRAMQKHRRGGGATLVRVGRTGLISGGIAGGAALGTTTAHAAIDVSGVTQEINDNQGSATEIGLAVISFLGLILAFFLLRRAVR